MPSKNIRRYLMANGSTSAGTASSRSTGATSSSLMSASAAPPTSATMSEVCTARCTVLRSPLPMAVEIVTFAPSDMPMNIVTSSPIMGALAPTAAMATGPCAPVKRPTMATSAALNNCCKMPLKASGNTNARIWLQSGPVTILDSGLEWCIFSKRKKTPWAAQGVF